MDSFYLCWLAENITTPDFEPLVILENQETQADTEILKMTLQNLQNRLADRRE